MKASDYAFFVREEKGVFFVCIPEIGIFAEASTFEEATRLLQIRFEQDQKISKVFGAKIKPVSLKLRDKVREDLMVFFVKTVVVIVVLLAGLAFVAPVFSSLVRHELKSTFFIEDKPLKEVAVSIPRNFNRKWEVLSEQEAKEIKTEWSKLFKTIGPFITELKQDTSACSCDSKK